MTTELRFNEREDIGYARGVAKERKEREDTVKRLAALHILPNEKIAEVTGFTVKEVEAILSRK